MESSGFATQAQAQAWFKRLAEGASNDVAVLDGDHDGIACIIRRRTTQVK
jgi:hypothetical protein